VASGFLVAFAIGIALPVLPTPVSAQPPGGVNSGGGTRTSGDIQVTDALGGIAGTASSASVQMESGFLPGLPAITPVNLRMFHFALIPEGVGIRWEGNPDLRIYAFRLERAVVRSGEPADEDYARLETIFQGHGPHEYLDEQVEAGFTYFYRIILASGAGKLLTLGPWSVAVNETPSAFTPVIHPAYPNPFRGAVVMSFNLAQPTKVSWRMLDVRGRRVTSGALGEVSAGYHAHTIRPMFRLPAGIYFLHVQAGRMSQVQKLVVLP